MIIAFAIQVLLAPWAAYGDVTPTTFTGSEPEKIGDWIYYVKDSYNYSLFKMGAGNKDQLVATDYAGYSLAIGDRIYFPNPKDEDLIYSMKPDGSELEKFWSEKITLYYSMKNLMIGRNAAGDYFSLDTKTKEYKVILDGDNYLMGITENSIFYREGETLFRAKLDGTKPVKVSGFDSSSGRTISLIDKETIYYTEKQKTYTYNMATKKKVKLSDKELYNFQLLDKKIYYKDPIDYKVYSMDLAGKGKKLVISEDAWFTYSYDESVYLNGSTYSYKIAKSGKVTKLSAERYIHFATKYGVYYTLPNESYGFTKMKADGSGEEVLIKKRMYTAQLLNNTLYYSNSEGLFAASLDGLTENKIFDGYIYDFKAKGDWVYVNSDGYIYNISPTGTVNQKTKIGSNANILGSDVYFLGLDTSALYRVPMAGGTPEVVDSSYCSDLYVHGNLYYVTQTMKGDYQTEYKLMKVAADGKSGTFVGDVPSFSGYSGDYAKYYNSDLQASYVMKLDGTGPAEYKYPEQLMTTLEGNDYYVNPSDNNYLYKRKVDGTGETLLLRDADIQGVYVKDGITYVKGSDNKYTFIFSDGKIKRATLKDCNLYTIKIIGDSAYYSSYRLDAVEQRVSPLTD